ncbi:MAG: SAM-dependent methyltransferase [Chloroflexi bacterium]|nr:SAM-dependent methyltransferase [Chloroflexota bacterium]
MDNEFDIILKLTRDGLSPVEQKRASKDFAVLLGWEPSDQLDPAPSLEDVSNGHLVVEHGLENAAVITFLKTPAASLQPEQTRDILSISYNNLIDWHIYVETDKVTYVFNRKFPPDLNPRPFNRSNLESLKSTMFDQVTGTAPNPNFPALDHALAGNISYWKRNLGAELAGRPQTADYSTLFNALIFVRAAEDHATRVTRTDSKVLLDEWTAASQNSHATLHQVLVRSLERYVNVSLPTDLLDLRRTQVFDDLNPDLARDLLWSFYKHRHVPYSYDFAIMSKHALSRIYEHYVSILRFDAPQPQLSFFPPLPREESDKSYGSIYTPQFIARFFARYLYENLPPSTFRQIKALDPACGSGIFLRTLLEVQCERPGETIPSSGINQLFANVYGIDKDENATQATKLSLSLLFLVLMGGELPQHLKIVAADALQYLTQDSQLIGTFDAVVANPPFVSADTQSAETREEILRFLGNLARGKVDTSLPFVKIGIDALKPEGYGLFVLPDAFLRNASAEPLRHLLYEKAWIRCLVDLSAIPVFRNRGSYVILLVFQKKSLSAGLPGNGPKATVIKCDDLVGHALQDFLWGRRVQTNFYSIFDVNQEVFSGSEWIILPPGEASIRNKFSEFKRLNEFLEIKQGIITGSDDVLVIPKDLVPKGEGEIWAPLLKDRRMERYSVPRATSDFVFFPIADSRRLTTQELQKRFPKTWAYLTSNKRKLQARRSIRAANWWEPSRNLPSDKSQILRPKILSPHLVLLPRFSLDQSGKYVVSHSPYLYPKAAGSELELLKFFLGILNSTVGAWLISTHSDKYSRGYARLEVDTLSSLRVPDPTKVPPAKLSALVRLVENKLQGDSSAGLDLEIDKVVADLYGLTHDERLIIGFEGYHG